jgi:hypothetical protein
VEIEATEKIVAIGSRTEKKARKRGETLTGAEADGKGVAGGSYYDTESHTHE